MEKFDTYLFIGVFIILFIIYNIFKKNWKNANNDYYIINGAKIPKKFKYFNVRSDNKYGQIWLDSFNEVERSELVNEVLCKFSGYHLYDFDEIEYRGIDTERKILFTNYLVDFFGLEKVKEMKWEFFSFYWNEVVLDVRESTSGYTSNWCSMGILFREEYEKNLREIEKLKKTNPELFPSLRQNK